MGSGRDKAAAVNLGSHTDEGADAPPIEELNFHDLEAVERLIFNFLVMNDGHAVALSDLSGQVNASKIRLGTAIESLHRKGLIARDSTGTGITLAHVGMDCSVRWDLA